MLRRGLGQLGITVSVVAAIALPGCAVDPGQRLVSYGEYRLEPTKYEDLTGWEDDALLDAVPALLRSCDVFARGDGAGSLGLAGRAGRESDWLPACRAFGDARFVSATDVRQLLEQWFLPFRVTERSAREGHVSGYAEISLRGSMRQTDYFRFPIYAPPSDMLDVDPLTEGEDWPAQVIRGYVADFQMQPYFDRVQIEAGALDDRGLELVWVDDALDLFELHQRGEGVVVLDTGELRRVTAANDNGHPRGSIVRTLIARDILSRDSASWAAARAWLDTHPDQAESMMRSNRRYSFFQWSEDQGAGPRGAHDVGLTPGRSLAVDVNLLPLGVPVWIDVAGLEPGTPRIRRLTVAQDIEAGVSGFISGSLFWGAGEDASAAASVMNSAGRMYVLLPRIVAEFE